MNKINISENKAIDLIPKLEEKIKILKRKNIKMKKMLELAALELRNTGAGEGEWMYRLYHKINKALES